MENTIAVVNMRTFFNREIFMHSIGDLRFKQPIALKQALYTVIFMFVWAGPIILTFGFHMQFWFFLVAFVPPFILGRYANKPIWGGRTLIDFAKVTFAYLGEPRGWTDHKPNDELGKGVYTVDHDFWVSRRRELQLLADLKEERKTGQKGSLHIVNNDNNDNHENNASVLEITQGNSPRNLPAKSSRKRGNNRRGKLSDSKKLSGKNSNSKKNNKRGLRNKQKQLV